MNDDPGSSASASPGFTLRPAAEFGLERIVPLYNRVWATHPMPMPLNGRRMAAHIDAYSVTLKASRVAMTDESPPRLAGMALLALRGQQAWIMGPSVAPEYRTQGLGSRLLAEVLAQAASAGATRAQVEVFAGDTEAFRFFTRHGFQARTNLIALRRPPGRPDPSLAMAGAQVFRLESEEIPSLLSAREEALPWIEATPSLLRAGSLQGIGVMLLDGQVGWVVYQRMPFQMTHITLSRSAGLPMAQTLLYQLHLQNPLQDAKLEALPADHIHRPAFEALGYVVFWHLRELVRPLST